MIGPIILFLAVGAWLSAAIGTVCLLKEVNQRHLRFKSVNLVGALALVNVSKRARCFQRMVTIGALVFFACIACLGLVASPR